MKYLQLLTLILLSIFVSCTSNNKLSLETDYMKISIDQGGNITAFTDISSGKNYLADNIAAPLLSVQTDNEIFHPVSAGFSDDGLINLYFKNDITASVKYSEKDSHISFELTTVSDKVDLIIWGPYPTIINKSIGETVGIAQGEEFTLGIQALNPKTLGGYPWNDNDCMPQIDIFDQDDPSDLNEDGKRYVLYRVEAAKPTGYGSSLQAYCRDRSSERIIENWNHEKYTAPAFEDGGVTGTKIALFGCPVEVTLETIGEIEISENLPHPMIDGEWGKMAKSASAAYIILDFGEKDIDKAIEITRRAGLRYLYHSGPFHTWGHFLLREDQFPNGIAGFKSCVEKAESQDIMIGVHTLSNFITTNDPYVTPIPDQRLAQVGASFLTLDIDATQTKIQVDSPDFFNQFKNNSLRTVRIGDELVRYGDVSETEPWILVGCQRGAFNTISTPHKIGESISKLADHAYKVFLTNPELTIEMSKNIADFFNKTGVRQISFDGLEGNRSTGMGNYGEVLFTQTWYDNLDDKIKQHYIADASRTSHYFWHMYTRMNWGEPWYAGFRESQTEYRMKNQPYFKRNLMPSMLGWFRLTPSTSVEDIEWMLARSAAFTAGYAFVVDYNSLEKNGNADEILQLIGEWEKVRMADVFTEEQRTRMEDISNEFHLEGLDNDEWNLYQVYSHKFSYEKRVKQPGEPLYSSFSFENPIEKQTINFILTAEGAGIGNIRLEIDNYLEIRLNVKLRKGEIVKYTGGDRAIIYNETWNRVGEVEIDESSLVIPPGTHNLDFECLFEGEDEASVRIEIITKGVAEKV